jgi:ribonuclease R
MAKAFYSDKMHMHFGLALKYYSHFTSPIRRYPDLQIHRIIKEELHHTLDTSRKSHYRTILKKIAKKCSDGEVLATEVERSIDALFLCQYMSDKI